MMAATSHRGRTSRLAIITFVVLLSFAPVRAHAADGFFGNLWCDITGFFGFACEEVPAPTTLAPGDVRVTSTLPPPLEEKDQWTESTTSEGRVVYTTVIEEHNHYTTNPTTIIRQGGGGGSSGNWDGVSLELFHKQVDRIYDSMGNAADGLQESIAEAFTTAVLTVTGNASVGGDLNVTGTLTAGSLSVTSVSSGGAVEAPYFTATSSTASTFPYASTTAISSSYASSTNGFFGNLSIGSLSGVLKATAGAISAAAVNLASEVSGVLAVANGGTGWASIASGFIPYGNGGSALATSTALSFDGTKFTTTYASTTAFTVSGSTYLATSGGNVGIGTTTPGSKLHVAGGNITIDNASSYRAYNNVGATLGLLSVSSGNNVAIGPQAGTAGNTQLGAIGDFQFLIGGATEVIRIKAGGNVGIGTAAPDQLLHVKGTTDYLAKIQRNSATDNDQALIGFSVSASDTFEGGYVGGLRRAGDSGGLDLVFGTNLGGGVASEKMRITGTGNVGIGTTTPAQKLHVTVDSNSIQIPARFENANTGNAVETRMQFVSGTAIGQFQLFGSGHATTPRLFRISGSSDGGDMRFATVGNDRLTITSTGNVGIGTTSPWRKLSVTGSVGFDGLTGAVGAGSLCLSANKEVTYNSGSDNCLSSTRATKHDINALDADAISLVNALQPVSFIYNGTERTRYGFIAEDTAAIDGILATYNDAGELTGIDDRSILSVVVKAFQELYTAVMSRFTAQDARFDALEERIRELEAREGINTPPPEPDSEAGDDDESANDPTDDLPDETLGGGEIPDTIDEETPVEEEQSAPDDDVVETPEPETPDDTEGSEPSPEPPPSE